MATEAQIRKWKDQAHGLLNREGLKEDEIKRLEKKLLNLQTTRRCVQQKFRDLENRHWNPSVSWQARLKEQVPAKMARMKDRAHAMLNREDTLERKIEKAKSQLRALQARRKSIQARFR